jgi:hypothetical protein
MNWLVLSYFLSIGTLGQWGQFIAPDIRTGSTFEGSYSTAPRTYQTTLGIEAQAFDNLVFVGGSVETWETFNGGFYPFESLYIFDAGLRWKGFELGYRHQCDHPTLDKLSLPEQGYGFTRDEFYMSFKSSFKVF